MLRIADGPATCFFRGRALTVLSDLGRAFVVGFAVALTVEVATASAAGPNAAWQEHFDRPRIDWVDPFNPDASVIARVYSIRTEGTFSFLHARHDFTVPSPPPAVHYGKEFGANGPSLDKVTALKWRWRVTQHPSLAASQDAWVDVAAALYVLIRKPAVFIGSARGFKFGWLSKPWRSGESQHGLIEESVRVDPAGPNWNAESVDLCALYEREYKSTCAGEHVLYVGVVTDADGSKSVSEADYADLEIDAVP
jgi:hypothetical protein